MNNIPEILTYTDNKGTHDYVPKSKKNGKSDAWKRVAKKYYDLYKRTDEDVEVLCHASEKRDEDRLCRIQAIEARLKHEKEMCGTYKRICNDLQHDMRSKENVIEFFKNWVGELSR